MEIGRSIVRRKFREVSKRSNYRVSVGYFWTTVMLIARFLKFDWPPDIILAVISFNRDVYAKLRFLDLPIFSCVLASRVKQTAMQ